uniref:Uncharacterized protein n=1 Tax=Sphaerodactylus townsendi TaxID=933632 RepID=A0ACB8F853_9SAUR
MSSLHLNNRAESHFQAQEEHELETLGKKAWDNPVYNGSPSSSLKIRAIYNPKAILENPYENTEQPSGALPDQGERKEVEGAKRARAVPSCCLHIARGIRVVSVACPPYGLIQRLRSRKTDLPNAACRACQRFQVNIVFT